MIKACLSHAARLFALGALLVILTGQPALAGQPDSQTASRQPTESVVLLHGLGETRAGMWMLQYRFRRAGYRTFNFHYSAARQSLDEISRGLAEFIHGNVKGDYHIVAHSLGNVIVRNGFRFGFPDGLKRIVMLSPPNHPAKLARRYRTKPLYRLFGGDAGQKLADENFYRRLPSPPVEFGVIAGSRGQCLTFDEPNDLIITVESTKLAGMKDFRVLRKTHPFLKDTRAAFDYSLRFLRTGSFAAAAVTDEN